MSGHELAQARERLAEVVDDALKALEQVERAGGVPAKELVAALKLSGAEFPPALEMLVQSM